jgi:hypothetical protein
MFVRRLAPEVDLAFSPDGRTMLESRGPLPVKGGTAALGSTWTRASCGAAEQDLVRRGGLPWFGTPLNGVLHYDRLASQ